MAGERISDVAIAQAARGAGVTDPSALAIAVAVALAESSGRPEAHNPVPPDDSYGLWQINLIGKLRGRLKDWGLTSPEQLKVPATNAKAMASISNGGRNWRPWTTYTSGAYLLYLPRGKKAAAAAGSAQLGDAIATTAGAVGSALGETLGDNESPWYVQPVVQAASAGAWMANRDNWIRVAKVVAGGGVLLVGLLALTGGGVASAAAKVVPVGKAAKVAGKVLK